MGKGRRTGPLPDEHHFSPKTGAHFSEMMLSATAAPAARPARGRAVRPAGRLPPPCCMRRSSSSTPGPCWPPGRRRLPGRRRPVEDRGGGAPAVRHDAEHEAREEEQRGEDRGGARERVRLAAPGHEARDAAASAAAAEPEPAFGALEQHDADQREHDDQVDDDENRLHIPNPSGGPRSAALAHAVRLASSTPGVAEGRRRRRSAMPRGGIRTRPASEHARRQNTPRRV